MSRPIVILSLAAALVALVLCVWLVGCGNDTAPRATRPDELAQARTQIDSLTNRLSERDHQIEQMKVQLEHLGTPSFAWLVGMLTAFVLLAIVTFAAGLTLGIKGLRAYRSQLEEQPHGPAIPGRPSLPA